MEKDQNEAERYDETDGKEPNLEERLTQRAAIGKLVAHQLTIDKPAKHDTREEGARGQHELGRQEVAEVHQRHAQYLNFGIGPH